jgi:hypothetical protein
MICGIEDLSDLDHERARRTRHVVALRQMSGESVIRHAVIAAERCDTWIARAAWAELEWRSRLIRC